MADIMRKPGKRTGGVILRCRLWHRMQGKTVWRMTGTEERDSLHARRVSVLRKSDVKIFYFRYFVIMRFCGTAHRCRLLIPNGHRTPVRDEDVFLVSESKRFLPPAPWIMYVLCFLLIRIGHHTSILIPCCCQPDCIRAYRRSGWLHR